MEFIVIAYYTVNTIYEEMAKTFMKSCSKLGVMADIQPIYGLGSWQKNTHYKPFFIQDMMAKYPNKALVYCDVDAEFRMYPELFEELNCDCAVYELDHSQFRRGVRAGKEVLSGTIYFGPTDRAKAIVEAWILYGEQNPTAWDQSTLMQALNGDFTHLPPQYCQIYDYMKEIPNPVITHYQASREQRRIERAQKGI
jgi:hypothetical protein